MPLPAGVLEYLILMLNVYSSENSKKKSRMIPKRIYL
jgi:hypothetical protein